MQVLTSRGFTFCDDDDEDDNISEEQPLHAQQHAVPSPELLLPAALEPLILNGVEASSTDAPEQSIGARAGGACPCLHTAGDDEAHYMIRPRECPAPAPACSVHPVGERPRDLEQQRVAVARRLRVPAVQAEVRRRWWW